VQTLLAFLKALRDDPRISWRNRLVLAGLVIWLLSPVDLIPDWLPIAGQLDDLVVFLLILDYLFVSADSDIILEHWPWSKGHFMTARYTVKALTWVVPRPLKRSVFRFAEDMGRRMPPGAPPPGGAVDPGPGTRLER
jgi:uncharacterized membrane protein YkvA (DUF1232 family)